MAKDSSNVQAAGVDKTYTERPDAFRAEEENILAEGRAQRTDQIADYHLANPTLDPKTVPSQQEIDAALQATKTSKKGHVKEAVVEAQV